MTVSPGNSDSIRSIYLIAICGTGMTALAGMLKECGYNVSGSDLNVYPPMSTFLEKIGIKVNIGYDEQHLEPAPDLVVIGNAMSRGNPEVEAVLEKKINYISRNDSVSILVLLHTVHGKAAPHLISAPAD